MYANIVVRVEDIVHDPNNVIIIIMLTVIGRQNILRTTTIKEVLILVTNILDQIVLKVCE